MSEPIESVERTIQLLQAKIRDLERQTTDHKRAVNSLCGLIGRAVIYDVEGAGAHDADIFPDEFYGKNLTTAIRVILDRRSAGGHGAATLDDIFDALVSGGYHFETRNDDNCKRSVYNTLSKNAALFHKLPNGRYGLLQWYPHAKGQRDPTQRGSNGEPTEVDTEPSEDEGPPHQEEPPANGPAAPRALGPQIQQPMTSLPAPKRRRKADESHGV